MTTATTDIICGFRVLIPNKVIDADGFYISYNDYDIDLYGGATTALVKGQFEHFYILDYFKQNIESIAKYSER